MKISAETLNILKNFSSINQSILLRAGNTIRIVSKTKTVMASANISEDIPEKAGIYDINRFIATLMLFDDPDIEFGESQFNIKADNRRVRYKYAAENMIVTPPDKDLQLPEPEATVKVSWSELDNIIKAASVLDNRDIAFIAEDGTIRISAMNVKTPGEDQYSVVVAEGVDCRDFRMVIQRENLKLLPNDYSIALSESGGAAHFKSSQVQYWIAVDAQ